MKAAYLLFPTLVWALAWGLSYDGCENGWVAFNHHCYYFGVQENFADPASTVCRGLGAELASLWGEEERDFVVDNLWKSQVSRENFAWCGLYANSKNKWAWRDGSEFSNSQLDTGVAGSVANKTSKCGALKGTGSYAFLNCSMNAQAFVCKKALPMVYITSPVGNGTTGTGHELFERLVPPELSTLPSASLEIEHLELASETGCAFFCFSLKECTAFEYTCLTHTACGNFTCKLLYNV